MAFAARVTDPHVCPMNNPAVPPVPHVGGAVLGPGAPTVLVCGLLASTVGDVCACNGPPDLVASGSTTVLIVGRAAARVGDLTVHGGTIVAGAPTVLIGG